MKKLLLLAAFSLLAIGAYAQGNVNFANVGVGVNAPVTNGLTGAKATGSEAGVQLYWGPAGTADASLLTTNGLVGGRVSSFLTGAQAGYFTGGSVIINGAAGGTVVTLQVRGWLAGSGTSWETAAPTARGASQLIQFTLGTPPATAPNITTLQSFTIGVIPEPSSIALGLLGLGAVALFRRRK